MFFPDSYVSFFDSYFTNRSFTIFSLPLTLLQHYHHNATTTSPQNRHNTTTTPQHHHNTTTTPLQHHHNTTTTPAQHHYNTATTTLQHYHQKSPTKHRPVLNGLLLYIAVTICVRKNQLFERIMLLVTEQVGRGEERIWRRIEIKKRKDFGESGR